MHTTYLLPHPGLLNSLNSINLYMLVFVILSFSLFFLRFEPGKFRKGVLIHQLCYFRFLTQL